MGSDGESTFTVCRLVLTFVSVVLSFRLHFSPVGLLLTRHPSVFYSFIIDYDTNTSREGLSVFGVGRFLLIDIRCTTSGRGINLLHK